MMATVSKNLIYQTKVLINPILGLGDRDINNLIENIK